MMEHQLIYMDKISYSLSCIHPKLAANALFSRPVETDRGLSPWWWSCLPWHLRWTYIELCRGLWKSSVHAVCFISKPSFWQFHLLNQMYFLKKINLNNYDFWCEVVPAAEITIQSLNPTNIYHYLQFDVLSLFYSILRGSVGGVIQIRWNLPKSWTPTSLPLKLSPYTPSWHNYYCKYQWYIY